MDVRRSNHLGDVLETLAFLRKHGLEEDDGARQRVAELLGFVWRSEPVGRQHSRPVNERRPARRSTADREEKREHEPIRGNNDAWVTHHKTAKRAPEWYSQVDALPPTDSAVNLPELPLIPLFNPAWTRAILLAALAQEAHDGDLDVDSLSERIASGKPVRQLPRLPRDRLDQGVQVLVDVREAMRPFVRDQHGIVADICALLPRDQVEIVRFPGCPSSSGWMEESTEEVTYRLPRAGTLVLLLTDLGLGPRLPGLTITHPSDWEQFALRLRRVGCLVTALVPYSPRRLPARLRKMIVTLPWCRQSTSGQVVRLRRRVERRIRI